MTRKDRLLELALAALPLTLGLIALGVCGVLAFVFHV